MKVNALLVVLLAQALSPSPRELLDVARPLTITEIAAVLNASQQALTAKTFRLSSVPGGQELEVLMGPAGWPKTIRRTYGIESGIVGGVGGSSTRPTETRWHQDVINIIDFTGRPARRCNGSAEQGEMVIEYVLRSSTPAWTATARQRGARDVRIAPALEMLRGAGPIASGERRRIGDRWVRALVSQWAVPGDRRTEAPLLIGDPLPNVVGDPAPNEATQSLWIDTESLLPLRWELSKRGLRTDFTYESISLGPPTALDTPDCIQ